MEKIDVNGNQKIDYEEFIAATIHLNKLNREELMVEAFKYFDKDNSGFITQEELHVRSLGHIGKAPEPRAVLIKSDPSLLGNRIELTLTLHCLAPRR